MECLKEAAEPDDQHDLTDSPQTIGMYIIIISVWRAEVIVLCCLLLTEASDDEL